MNTAQYIVKRLEELGVNEFFGTPESCNFDFIYAIEDNPNTSWIGCTNTLNAGYAADGYARIRGYGAVVTTYGTGELSAINAIAGSFAENVPVVNIVGLPATKEIENKTLYHHSFQEPDYCVFLNTYKSVTAATAFLTRDNAKLEIDRVLKVLVKEKKPVYIAIPNDIALMNINDRDIAYDWISDKDTLEDAAKKISEKITNSKKPVIIGDILIKRFDAEIEYKEFIDKSKIPVSNFLMGTNIIDMDYENYIGSYFGIYKNPIAKKYIEESDCLITVGAIYNDLNTFGQNLPTDINNNIAIYGTYTYIEGNLYNNIKMADLLEAVTNLISLKEIKIEKPNIGLKTKDADSESLTTSYIYPRIQEYIKDNDIIIAETGTVSHGLAQMKFPHSANVQFQLLWSSIGWATPAALGACLAKPQSRVILITGDGAHQNSALEIGTMLKLGIKPIVIVINNNGYSSLRLLSNDTQDSFNDIMQINYAKFARAFEGDIWATKVSTPEDFDKALKVTQIMNKMCYIEATTDAMDVPEITKEFMESEKNKLLNIEIPKTNIFAKSNIQDLVLTTSDSKIVYETVVHRSLNENADKKEG